MRMLLCVLAIGAIAGSTPGRLEAQFGAQFGAVTSDYSIAGGGGMYSSSVARSYRVYRVARTVAPMGHPYQPNPGWYEGQPLEGGMHMSSRFGAYRIVPGTPPGGYAAQDGTLWFPMHRVGTVEQRQWSGAIPTARLAWRVRIPGSFSHDRIPRTPPAEVLAQFGADG